MYKFTDLETKMVTITNDHKDIMDMVMGYTYDENTLREVGEKLYGITFGDNFKIKHFFKIECIPDPLK